MYMCVCHIDFAYFHDFIIEFWNCSYRQCGIFVSHFIVTYDCLWSLWFRSNIVFACHLISNAIKLNHFSSLFLILFIQVRTGPGLFGNGKRNFTHAFDGFSKLYNWKFYGNGTASFSVNFLRSGTYNISTATNDIANFFTFETVTPPFPLAEREMSVLKGMDNTNINVYRVFNEFTKEFEYLTLSDTWKVYLIEPLSTGTIGAVNAEVPPGISAFVSIMSSAHPLPEHNSTHHFTFLTSVSVMPGIKSRLSVVRIKSTSQRELVAQWEVTKAPYMHAFSVTPNYVILFAAPYYINVVKLLEYADAYSGLEWFPSENATIHVVEIKTGKVTSIDISTMNPSHHANAYEEDGKIIMDTFIYPDPFFANCFALEVLRNESKRDSLVYAPHIKRFTIDLNTRNVIISTFAENPKIPFINNMEIPAINENYRHKKYCYLYGVALKSDKKSFSKTALGKLDVCGNNEDKFWFTEGHFPLEMWFVPTPNATREDDGVLLTPVMDGQKRQSYLLLLNATTMTTINRAYLPSLVPFTIHGRFFPDLV